MRRVFLSIIGGVAVPILYLMAIGILAIVSYYLIGIRLPDSIMLPISWSGVIYNRMYPDTSDFQMFSELRVEVIVALIIGDFLLYSFLTYIVLYLKGVKK